VKKQRKFLLGGSMVFGIVGYLMVTGMNDAMLYYHTPTELIAKIASDPSYQEVGVKVGGRVNPGTVTYDNRTLDLRFELLDIEGGTSSFAVLYQGPLPETFEEGGDVVLEGRFNNGVFQASSLLTKCGSRYEASEADYLT
jgi:cytochrome c-type biogenesis protein CcmE